MDQAGVEHAANAAPVKQRSKAGISSLLARQWRNWMIFVLAVSDFGCLAASLSVAVLLRSTWPGFFDAEEFLGVLILLPAFLIVYGWRNLYPGIGLGPVDELRRLSWATSIGFLALAASTYLLRNGVLYSRFVYLASWLLALVLLPLGRTVWRGLLARYGLWGKPVAIVGAGENAAKFTRHLLARPVLGLRPEVVLDGRPTEWVGEGDAWQRLRHVSLASLGSAESSAQLMEIETAVVVMADYSAVDLHRLITDLQSIFPRMITIPNLPTLGSTWVASYDLGGIVGLEVRHNLLNRREQLLKRMLDLFLAGLATLVVAPLLALLALVVWIDTRGGLLYAHRRIGKDGRELKLWKFQTMVKNADQMLEGYLQAHPERRQEWEATYKLKDDPRVTRLGSWLRRFSLDELPQLWNVLRGEMSLVGPRPITTEEAHHYHDRLFLYLRVPPGITGLWQVSGRSDTTYAGRVELDEYYVRNWSVWMDIYVLARTPWAVFSRDGAY